ncbi:transcriptional regulator, LysR family [Burkholderia sp. lig30]|jgi:DNA-binding transcriptional LysR family regulator|uniref:LysR family transcriptional regulator n=1 Tax=Burkholderia sp. lig30 TaxID=1192124 RepID=UPI000461C092|nr:LysR family transcriptional regulator [Burkholderia sp. lig30]KDB08168.1 transcriptional regulator, LysR family [Burkholderia sp. lig30]
MELWDVDLNLLVIFNELLHQRRVSAVAGTLEMSQPAVSNAMNRLRKLLGDELFLRTANGMVPTPLAERLAEPIGYALGAIHSSLNEKSIFEPATSKRKFTLAMTDIGEIYFLPGLMEKMERSAPGVTISTEWNTSVNLREEMETGKVDLAIGFVPDLKSGFFQRRLFKQRYVCLFRRGHPLAEEGISLKAFRAAQHVAVVAEGTGHGMVDEVIQRAGVTRNVRLRVPHFVAVGHILQNTDMIAVVPEAYANRTLEPFGLESSACPVKIPDIVINVLWHAKNHREPGNQWLRQMVFDAFSS